MTQEVKHTVGRSRRIPLRVLRRFESELIRFANAYHMAYGTSFTGEESDDQSETIRNALTALAHVECWIPLRERSRRDPSDFSRADTAALSRTGAV
jgi:hypothetical protein